MSVTYARSTGQPRLVRRARADLRSLSLSKGPERVGVLLDPRSTPTSPRPFDKTRERSWPLFEALSEAVGSAPPVQPRPLSQDGLLGLFDGDTVGRDVALVPATMADMRGVAHVERPSLEIVYDAA